MKKKRRIRGGGLFMDTNNEDIFRMFMENSDFSYLSSGTYGYIFVAKLKDGVESGYKSMNPFHFREPVNSIIIKIVFIEEIRDDDDYDDFNEYVPEEYFKEEINIQTDTFLKTMNYLQPICPAIVYANITKDSTYAQLILSQISSTSLEDIVTRNMKYGIIGMELAEGYKTLNDLVPGFFRTSTEYFTLIEKKVKNVDLFKNQTIRNNLINIIMSYYILIEFVMKTGYNHGDYHCGNILINKEDDTYFAGIKGAVSLIDFGYSEKIDPEIMKEIKELYKNHEYVEILKKLCSIHRKDGLDLTYYPHFMYVCYIAPNYHPIINQKIKNLIQQKEEQKDKIVALFAKKREEGDKMYPYLPLSNSAKNKMYMGIEDTPVQKTTKKTIKRTTSSKESKESKESTSL